MSPVFFTTFKLPANFIPASPFWLGSEAAKKYVEAQRDFWAYELEQQIKDELRVQGFMPEQFEFEFEWYDAGYMPSVDFETTKGQVFTSQVKAPILEVFNHELKVHQASKTLVVDFKKLLDVIVSFDSRITKLHLRSVARSLNLDYNSDTGDTLGTRIQTSPVKSQPLG